MAKIGYSSLFTELLEPYVASSTLADPEVLFSDPRLDKVGSDTKRKQLKKFISENVKFAQSVEGILPRADTIIDIAERELGQPISEINIVAANRASAKIVERIRKPALKRFVQKSLISKIQNDSLSISTDDLLAFLTSDYEEFRVGAGNGLVSIAGTLNERLLVRCLLEKDLIEGKDFTVTGKKSDGDIVLHTQSGSKKNLGIEIKSYHARERLLRGLQDVQQPKAGAGFFIDPSEFNEKRTPDLLATNAAAIYMPQETLDKVITSAVAMTTNDRIALGCRLYRPLEQFGSDMKYYCANGTLPSY